MTKLFLLSKQNIELAKEEILSLTENNEYELHDDLLIIDDKSKIDFENRLGYTHTIYKFLFKCKKEKLTESIKSYNWQKIYNKDFCVRVHNSSEFEEKEIASLIWNKIKNPKVNLTIPKTKIEFFFIKNNVIAALFQSNIDKSFLNRKAHLRPELHPTSLHPKLARACINLTGLTKGTLLDPFCGSGGILIEAGLMGFKVIGYDIDESQIKRAEINFKHYKVKNYKLKKQDSTNINKKVKAIVTDLPYGKGSKLLNKNLYVSFLNSSQNITKNMIIIFPDFINYKKLIKKTKWKIEKEFKVYIHKSLTRIILKLTQ